MQPSHPLLSPSPLALNFPKYQGLFQWFGSSHQVAKVFNISPSSEYSGLTSLKIDWLDLLAVQGVFLQSKDSSQESSPAPQFKSINSSSLNLL